MKRGVLYLRVSSKEQAEGYSLEAQKEAGVRYFAEHDIELVDIFEDGGESARTADRPDFQRMMRFVEDDGTIDYVVAHKLDRMARNLEDHVMIRARLRQAGTALLSITENFEKTPTGRLVEDIMASINEYYSNNLGEEVKKGQRQKIRNGGWPSHAPIGYRNVRRDVGIRQAEALLEKDPIQAPLVCVYPGTADIQDRGL